MSLLLGVLGSLSAKEGTPESSLEIEMIDARDFLGDTQSFVAERKAKLLTVKSDNDIFGRPQDLRKPAPVKTNTQVARVAAKKPRVDLAPILESIPITLLDTGSKRILLEGGATWRLGETFEVAFGGIKVPLRLDAVRRQGAYFRNMDNGEVGLAEMNGLGAGITRGNGLNSVEGIQRIDRNTPRTLDLNQSGSVPPSQGLSNR